MNIPIDLKDKKQQVIIAAVALTLTLIFLYFNFLLKPQLTNVFSLIDKAKRLESDLKRSQQDIASVAKLKKDIVASKEKVARYEKMLPAEQEIPGLLEDLSNMAKKSNIKIVSIIPAVAKEGSEGTDGIYQEIPILITAKSGYHELGNFLSNLENSDRFMKVADIGIRASTATPKKHDVELLVLTYTLLKRNK